MRGFGAHRGLNVAVPRNGDLVPPLAPSIRPDARGRRRIGTLTFMNPRPTTPRLDRFRSGDRREENTPPARGVAVTQIRLSRAQVDFLSRTSSATRLHCSDRYLMRIDILRLFVEELFRAGLDPERITSLRALETLLVAHFAGARSLADCPVSRLASCLESEGTRSPRRPVLDFTRRRRSGGDRAAMRESFTLRLSTADIVAIDTFRCDVRERCGFNLSRSGLLRALIDSFGEAVRAAEPIPRARDGARLEDRTASSPR